MATTERGKKKKRVKPPSGASWRNFIYEEARCANCFPSFKFLRIGEQIYVTGVIQPFEHSRGYEFKLEYSYLGVPKVHIVDPEIEFDPRIHMFQKDNSLCLYDHRIAPWKVTDTITIRVLNKIAGWLMYYQLWLDTGKKKWDGKEAPHSVPVKNQNGQGD